MNGFTIADLKRPGFVGRLLGRKPKENALVEIQNLLAQRPVAALTAAEVENILSDYELPRERALPALLDLYRTGLQHRSQDLNLSDQDKADLGHLRYVLGLEDVAAQEVEIDLLRSKYQEELKQAVQDGHLSDAARAKLEQLAANFGLPEAVQHAIYREEVLRVVYATFESAVADRRLTADEDQQLAAMATNLGVKLTHDAETQRNVERFRLLARIEIGQLPVLNPPIHLQRGEVCHAEFPSTLHELRTVTKDVAYHGPTGRIRIMKGLSWRYGYVNVNRVTSEELRQLDFGTLYITNKRLLFNGARKNVSIQLKRVIHFTLYGDGLQIEKDSGRDQFFKGEGDLEVLGAILESLLRQSR